MSLLPGVYQAVKKDGTLYYRSSITINRKHISLGSFSTEEQAHKAYLEALDLFYHTRQDIASFDASKALLHHDKWVTLINYRDNNIYIKTPIYLMKNYFNYYLSAQDVLKFDIDDLFYYSNHKIMQRNGHLFVSDYGMQVNILNRYGIKNYGVAGKDYCFVNNDPSDFRYGNIEIINPYHGVTKQIKNGRASYITRIIINGSYLVGKYSTESEAAVAYNKAAQILWQKGSTRNYPLNYIEALNEIEYASLYNKIRISRKIREWEKVVSH